MPGAYIGIPGKGRRNRAEGRGCRVRDDAGRGNREKPSAVALRANDTATASLHVFTFPRSLHANAQFGDSIAFLVAVVKVGGKAAAKTRRYRQLAAEDPSTRHPFSLDS